MNSSDREPEPSESLQSPLLVDDGDGDGDGDVVGAATLHGEAVDLRHFFVGRSLPANDNDNDNDNDDAGRCSSAFSLGEPSGDAHDDHHGVGFTGRLSFASFQRRLRQMASWRPKRHFGRSSRSHTARTSPSLTSPRRPNCLTTRSSLLGSPAAPLLFKLLLPLLLLANHFLFYRAQTQPMWNLAYQTDVAASATASTLKAKAAFDALNLPHRYEFADRQTKVVETFTYMDAIRKLWKAEGLGGGRVELLSKISAALLVAFSGVWPHLKLLLVHWCWLWPFARGVWLDDDEGEEEEIDEEEMEEEEKEEADKGREKGERTEEEGNSTTRSNHNHNHNHTDNHNHNHTDNHNHNHNTTTTGGRNHGEITLLHKPRTHRFSACQSRICCSDGHPRRSHALRTPFLRTLSTLGKWSLADVFVVCILIAVLHLDWDVRPDDIRSGVENELPTLLSYVRQKYPDAVKDCTNLLGYTCGKHALVVHYPECLACQAAINAAYSHPGWATSEGKDIVEGVTLEGGGFARLRVVGMIGTYYFCGAVVMSIFIGLLVETMDGRDGTLVEQRLLEKKREVEWRRGGTNGDGTIGGSELELREEGGMRRPSSPSSPSLYGPALNDALLVDDPSAAASANNGVHHRSATGTPRTLTHYPQGFDDPHTYTSFAPPRPARPPLPHPTTDLHLLQRVVQIVLSFASLPLVYYAITLPTMQRLVYGGGPTLLHEVLGMVWTKEYNLLSLVQTTGDAGGWDAFLMATFGMFVVVGPALRSVCLVLHILSGVPLAFLGDCIEQPRRRTTVRVALYRVSRRVQTALLSLVDALGSFCAWEVLIVALVMIQLEMPSITDTIYQDDRCLEADPEHGRTCIEVQFNALDNFLVVCVAWLVLVAASCLTMDLAANGEGEERDLTKEEERRYVYGMPIPPRRVWRSASAAGVGRRRRQEREYSAVRQDDDNDDDYDDDDDDEREADPSAGREGLEEIVFL